MAAEPLSQKQERFLKGLLLRGMVDERKLAYAASARTLPNGEYGLCLLCINRNILSVYAIDIHQTIGEKFYDIPLNQISGLKAGSFLLY